MDDLLIVEKLAEEWISSGINEGDTLLLHSSIRRTLRRYIKQGLKITPQLILDSFLQVVGTSGTLILPLFNFDFTKNIPFDISQTPSHMGALTEVGRLHPLAVRTGHPIYSFAVIGYLSEKFREIDNFSGYGKDSPFAELLKIDGKIAVLDLPDQNSMTFYHHVEEMMDVPYRYHKNFTSKYTDLIGSTELKTYGLFVRDIEKGVKTYVNPIGDLLWKKELYKGSKPGEGNGLRVISARKIYDFVSDIIISGKAEGLLYRIEEIN